MSSPLLTPPDASRQEGRRPWVPMIVGLTIVAVVVGALWLFTRTPQPVTTPESPYASRLKFSDLKMATANNFVGATVTYLEGKISNTGDQTVTRILAQITFRNSLNEIVQQERQPIMVLEERPGYADTVDLSMSPLAPGQTRDFRFTFEHISSDWNQALPELKVLTVETK